MHGGYLLSIKIFLVKGLPSKQVALGGPEGARLFVARLLLGIQGDARPLGRERARKARRNNTAAEAGWHALRDAGRVALV